MSNCRMIPFVDTHTAGEPTRIVLGGFPRPIGNTMEARRQWLSFHADGLRRFVLQEPRGHHNMFGAVLSAPIDPTCDTGVFFMESGGYLRMCGHGTIGVVTALTSMGWCNRSEVALDTPAGRVECRIGKLEAGSFTVSLRNVPSFYLGDIDIDGIRVSLAFGGNLFGLIDAAALGERIDRSNLASLLETAMALRTRINAFGPWSHPADGRVLEVELIEFYEEGNPPRNVVVFGHGQIDRSPCGTGTSAKMAYLHATGKLDVGERYIYRSVLGTEFVGRIVEETTLGDGQAVIPEITGAAHIIAMGNLILDGADPFPVGFELEEPPGTGVF